MVDETDEVEFEDAPPVPKISMPVTAERSFFAALRALKHLYFKLEKDHLELHSTCEVCDEIRNFLNVRDYRADDFDTAFSTTRTALNHLHNKLAEGGVKLDSASCASCIEIEVFVADPEYRGNLGDPLGVDMHRPLNYAPLGWVDEQYANSLRTSWPIDFGP